MHARAFAFTFFALCAACGGKTEVGASDAASDGTSDTPIASPCPSVPPTAGTSCGDAGLVCAYGDDPRWDCRTTATCNGTWSVTPSTCPPLPPATCPPTLADANGQTCATKDTYCSYDGLACHCTNCIEYPIEKCDGPMTWRCDAPNTDPGCPAAMPNAGTSCSAAEGTQCTYGCESGHARTCSGGIWMTSSSPYGCPVSSKKYKRDIEYLSFDELRAVADRVLSFKLATWVYLDPRVASGRRLGILVEDAAGTDAVAPVGDRVDLYGYTSMAIAAAQVNAHDVDALRREVEALRAQVIELKQTCKK